MDQLCKGRMSSLSRCPKAVYLILLLQIGLVKSVAENFYNPDYEEEFNQNQEWLTGLTNPNLGEIQSSLLPDSHPLDNLESQLKAEDLPKRHLGAMAALSGLKQRDGIPKMPKRHMGAIAAGSASNRPKSLLMPKRHFGSAIASKSGFRSPVTQYSLVGRSGLESQGTDKRNVAALARINSNPNYAFNRVVKSDDGLGFQDEDEDDQFYDNPIDMPLTSATGVESDTGVFSDEPISFKSKRFLGEYARSGWFPRNMRQYRGEADNNSFDKRHIGSAARVGWIPFSKTDRDELGLANGGFKRNLQSYRRLQFAAPSLWGRQRARRML